VIKGGEVLLVVPGVGWGVETISSHVGIDGLHGHVSDSTDGGNTSSGQGKVLGVLFSLPMKMI